MAPKRLQEDPPPAASSTEEEEESEEETAVSEGFDVEEDDHQNKTPTTKKHPVTTSLKASQRRSPSDSGDESGSESESESNKSQASPSASDFTIKPIASKSIEDSGKPQKNSSKRKLTLAPSTADTGGKKRASESDIDGKDPKKNKLSNAQDVDMKKGSGVQRLWSEDDEIAILKGLIEYRSKKGADPCAEMEAFHGFIKKSLHADVSKTQLISKIRRLKKKYQTSAGKSENGEDPVFSKPHEQKFFELSKKFWGSVATKRVDDNAKKKKKKKPTQSEVKTSALALANGEINAQPASSNSSFLDVLLAPGKLLSLPEGAIGVVKEALPLIGSARTSEFESKWRKLQEDECELYLKRVELVRDCAKLLFEAIKSSMS